MMRSARLAIPLIVAATVALAGMSPRPPTASAETPAPHLGAPPPASALAGEGFSAGCSGTSTWLRGDVLRESLIVAP